MSVAFELKKTVGEVRQMDVLEFADWLAFFNLRQERIEKETARRRRQGR